MFLLLIMTSCTSLAIRTLAFSSTRLVKRMFRPIRTCSPSCNKYMQQQNEEHIDFYETLYGNTLISIQDALDAAARNQIDTKLNSSSPHVIFFDGSWYHKGNRSGRSEYESGPRIRNAHHIDIDEISSQTKYFPDRNPKDLPHQLPPANLFASAMDHLNIRNDDHVIIYGKHGSIFTARTWFLFNFFGHDQNKVHILQASLEDWIEGGGAVDANPISSFTIEDLLPLEKTAYNYQAQEATNVVNMEFMLEVVAREKKCIILDTRGSSFPKGHIPGAINVPYESLVQEDNQLKFKNKEGLKQAFESAGVDIDDILQQKENDNKPTVICSCGTGVSACHLFVAMKELGRDVNNQNDFKTFLYDGSWAEWGQDPSTPKCMPKN